MSPQEIALVRTSFAQLAPLSLETGRLFYRHLFALAPDTQALFPGDIDGQARKLMNMLDTIVDGLDRPEHLHAVFADMGRRHVGYGAREDHYDAVGAALLRTLHEGLGDGWTPQVEDAWAAIYGEMAETMMAAADRIDAIP